ncbi:aldehyde dehydrogenase family protein [Nocardia anaemiae]|uniref:aldehyde dehydrogenase family protein n=1 Tax=Nocardia anaemiae TaxID=263910 RepID=UPI0007A4A174
MTAGFDVPPALLAGAAVLLKPSEITPLSGVELARGWAEIGARSVFSAMTGVGNIAVSAASSVSPRRRGVVIQDRLRMVLQPGQLVIDVDPRQRTTQICATAGDDAIAGIIDRGNRSVTSIW